MTTQKKWGPDEDTKLARLFSVRPSRGGVSSLDLSQKAVKAVHSKHFPERPYKTFAPLFRRKARDWELNKTLSGARLGKLLRLIGHG